MVLPALKFVKSPNYSSRGGRKVDVIVVHDCEGSFGGSIAWFQQAKSRVSAHIVLSEDGTQAVQMVDWANKAWHVCGINPMSEGIEAAGYSAKGLRAPEWQALAAIVAFRLHVRGLPPVWTRGGPGGFCQHKDLGAVGGSHYDITSDPSVMNTFVAMVQAAYAGPIPTVWVPKLALGEFAALPPVPPGWTSPPSGPRHDLIEGSLEWAQMELNVWLSGNMPNYPLLTVDGMLGDYTRTALIEFQRANNLAVSGDAGPQTIDALKAV